VIDELGVIALSTLPYLIVTVVRLTLHHIRVTEAFRDESNKFANSRSSFKWQASNQSVVAPVLCAYDLGRTVPSLTAVKIRKALTDIEFDIVRLRLIAYTAYKCRCRDGGE